MLPLWHIWHTSWSWCGRWLDVFVIRLFCFFWLHSCNIGPMVRPAVDRILTGKRARNPGRSDRPWPAVEFRMARDWECFKMVHEEYHLCIDDYWCPYVQQDSSDDDDDVSVNHMLICCWPLLSHFGHFSNAKMYSSSGSTCSTRSSVASMPCACMGWNHPRRPWPSEATKSLCLGPQRDIEMILYIYICIHINIYYILYIHIM